MSDERFLTAEQLDDLYNQDGCGGHPTHTRSMWRQAVSQGETLRGYWDWVVAQIEENADENQDQ